MNPFRNHARSRYSAVNSRFPELKEWFDSCVMEFKKQKVLLRGAMVKQRPVHIPSFLKSVLVNPPKAYKLSNLAGHGAFVCLALSYLENDFMNLRMYAVSGVQRIQFDILHLLIVHS